MSRPQVMRTCVGCRQRTAKPELLRVVLSRSGISLLAAPDPDGRAEGRGAHLHPTAKCLALAERRRAFARALRAEGSVDVSPVRRYVERLSAASD
ncbi:YlxR family protein [Flindersiella endophytica]